MLLLIAGYLGLWVGASVHHALVQAAYDRGTTLDRAHRAEYLLAALAVGGVTFAAALWFRIWIGTKVHPHPGDS
ncbi:MAG: hypothetical protein LC721_04490 [Actinobacteria bacterium]|nr:hypothetical protein [Actinomycetota bacterium]